MPQIRAELTVFCDFGTNLNSPTGGLVPHQGPSVWQCLSEGPQPMNRWRFLVPQGPNFWSWGPKMLENCTNNVFFTATICKINLKRRFWLVFSAKTVKLGHLWWKMEIQGTKWLLFVSQNWFAFLAMFARLNICIWCNNKLWCLWVLCDGEVRRCNQPERKTQIWRSGAEPARLVRGRIEHTWRQFEDSSSPTVREPGWERPCGWNSLRATSRQRPLFCPAC